MLRYRPRSFSKFYKIFKSYRSLKIRLGKTCTKHAGLSRKNLCVKEKRNIYICILRNLIILRAFAYTFHQTKFDAREF